MKAGDNTFAAEAGFLDQAAEAEELLPVTPKKAEQLQTLNFNAHTRSKQRMRSNTLKSLDRARRSDIADFIMLGIIRALKLS